MQTEETGLLAGARVPAASAAAASPFRGLPATREAQQPASAGAQLTFPAKAEEGCTASPTAAESGATLSDDRNHSQQQQLLEKRTTAADRLQGERQGPAVGDVFVAVDDEEIRSPKENDTTLVIVAFVLSFLFPPIGCLFFCLNLSFPPDSPRYVWAVRALEVGSLLSFVYSLVIIMLLSDFTLVYSQNKAHFGVGF